MGDSRVSRVALPLVVLLAITAVPLVSTTPDTTTTVLAAERIDLDPPGVPIRVAGFFGTDGPGATDLADSAAGDRAVAACSRTCKTSGPRNSAPMAARA